MSYPAWMNHPMVGFLGTLLGIVGILLAIFFYFESKVERLPYFYVEPARNILVSRELAIGQKLSVSFESRPISGDITALQCYLWNAGRGPIHEQDVLQPIKLTLSGGAEVLDVSVVRQSRPIVNFQVTPDRTPENKASNSASINFKILEQGDGATIQVLYTGGPAAGLRFEGTVESAQIKQLTRRSDWWLSSSNNGYLKRHPRLSFAVLSISFLLLLLLQFILDDFLEKSIPFKQIIVRKSFWGLVVVWLVAATTVYYYIFLSNPEIPTRLLT